MENSKIYTLEEIRTAREEFENADKALNEFSRVLKKNGILILTYPTIDQTIMAKIEKFLHIRTLTPVSEHLTEWDYREVIKKLEKHGFQIEKTEGIVYDFGNFEKIKKIAKWILMPILKLKLALNFPKNSLFVAFKFKKI